MERLSREKEPRSLPVDDLRELKTHPVGDYFSIDPTGDGVFLHDVLTLRPLEYGQVPEAIERTPELLHGLRHLEKMGRDGNLVVQLVLGPHGDADDFRGMARDHVEALASPLIGLEMAGEMDGSLIVASAPGRREFQQEQLRWAAENNKTIMPCELRSDDNSEISTRMGRLWSEIVEPALAQRAQDPVLALATAAIAERSYQAVRQWIILARLGTHLSDLSTEDIWSGGPLKIPLVLGSWHRPSVDRLEMLGVPCEVHQSIPSQDQAFQDYGEMAMTTTLLGYAPMDFLRTPAPY